MLEFDVVIIGAGAAGLMCAIHAARRGRKILVLDHANKAGKKILMSGGGRCNFTNLSVTHENFISHNVQFCKSALSRYTPWDFISMVQDYEIPYHEKTLGQLFCDNKSKDILNMLLSECEKSKLEIQLNTSVNKIKNNNLEFFLDTTHGDICCESLVVATGGLSIPTMGASPFAYKIAEQFGIKVWPTRAGLVPFTLHLSDKERMEQLSGVAIDCQVECNNQQFSEAMLFTHRGLSGPAMLQISSYWNPGDDLTVNLLAKIDIFSILKNAQSDSANVSLKNILNRYLPKRHVNLWLGEVLLNKAMKTFTDKELQHVADSFVRWQIKPNGTEGYRTAEVTLGGVDCDALSSKTFEVKNTAGLYFIGEALDVTGWLGGYNFQWAWASGYAAGIVV